MGVFEQFPYTNFHELNLDWVLRTMKQQVSIVEELKKEVEKFPQVYETIANISNKRKLSEKGDFTGKLAGRQVQSVLSKIDNNRDQLQFISNQFSDGATGLVIDGGFFEEDGIKKNYNGGMF